MILHLLFDSQFSDYVIEQFSGEGMLSDFVLVSNTKEMMHFRQLDAVRIINPDNVSEMNQLLADISKYTSVIFHGLFYQWQEWLLNNWPTNVKIAWVCWGGELYGQSDIHTSFLKPISRLANAIHTILHLKVKRENIFNSRLFSKIDFCLTCVEAEYKYAKKYIGNNIRYLPYNYYSIEETLGALKEANTTGNNIFLGNSATIENNHIEALLQLKHLNVGEQKVIIPLSYGSPWVRNMCLKAGNWLFKSNFLPLLTFIPREEYNATMLDCSVMIQPHLREQAHGNILTGLWLGMRVYLSEKGIDYAHFKQLGCHVYSIESDLQKNNDSALLPLSESERQHNRKILLDTYGKENIQNNLITIVKELTNNYR